MTQWHNGIAYDVKGTGPYVLLLHGFPQTRAMWRDIVPQLATKFTVVTADLTGYGESEVQPALDAYTFRAMGQRMQALMTHLGVEQFHVVGHDRGARVAHRMALDLPQVIASLTVMDIIPTYDLLTDLKSDVAKAYYHWFFLAQPTPFPETLIANDPDYYYQSCLLGWGGAQLSDFDPDLLAAYRAAWRQPARIKAMCDDYRAAIALDVHDDAQDRSTKVACPTLVLYGAQGAMAKSYDIAEVWAPRLANMAHRAISGGHFFVDQNPHDTGTALRHFLSA